MHDLERAWYDKHFLASFSLNDFFLKLLKLFSDKLF